MRAKMQGLLDAPWDDVRVFLAAHRLRGLGAAASRIGLNTSTVSRRIAALETALGQTLFERTRHGLLPTRAAERVLPAAEAMEAAHARLLRDASDTEIRAEGVVRLSCAPGIADSFVAPCLVRLRALHPLIDLEIDASIRAVDLTRYEADLALRSVPPRGAELVVTKIATSRWIVVGAPKLVARLGRLESWSDAPWITWDRDLATYGPARWVAQHAPKAKLALRTSHFATQLEAASTGLGLVMVPAPYARMHKLVAPKYTRALITSTESWPIDDLWLVGHRISRDVPRVAAVWEFLAKELRDVCR